MPLLKEGTKEAVSANIRRLRKEGKPSKQAIAIALNVSGKTRKKRRRKNKKKKL